MKMISFIILLKIYIIHSKRCNVESFEYHVFLLEEIEEK